MSKAPSATKWMPVSDDSPACRVGDLEHRPIAFDDSACERAAAIFRALGDPQRLRLLLMLESRSCCVSELAETLGESLPAISQRLRLLKGQRIVRSQRKGKHVFYSLSDEHIARLLANGIMHAREGC